MPHNKKLYVLLFEDDPGGIDGVAVRHVEIPRPSPRISISISISNRDDLPFEPLDVDDLEREIPHLDGCGCVWCEPGMDVDLREEGD